MNVYVAGDAKYVHLGKLENAAEKLKIFKADLLDCDTILAAVKGCDGVFHVASPVPQAAVPNPEAWRVISTWAANKTNDVELVISIVGKYSMVLLCLFTCSINICVA